MPQSTLGRRWPLVVASPYRFDHRLDLGTLGLLEAMKRLSHEVTANAKDRQCAFDGLGAEYG